MPEHLTQHPEALPPELEAYRRTNEFTEETLPARCARITPPSRACGH